MMLFPVDSKMIKLPVLRPRNRALALESRILFDGAAAVVAADQLAPAPEHHDTTPAEAKSPVPDIASAAVATPSEANDTSAPHTLVVIDKAVANWQQLAAASPPGSELLLLDTNRDGTQQIAEYLEGRGTYDSVHVISHGSAGQIILGNETLNVSNLSENAAQLQALATHLTRDADILIYGCDVAAGPNGSNLLTQLATLTGADLAGSIDATGSASKGGNWVLEQQNGLIESKTISVAAYDGLMAAPVNTVPSARTVAEDNTITFSSAAGTTVSIADSDGTVQSVTLSVTNGTLSLAGTSGLTVLGNDSASISITAGSIANINAALNGLIYRPTKNYAGGDTLTIATNDGSTTDTDTVGITVTPNATAPVLTLPATSQTVSEDTPTFLNFAGANAIVLTDADANDIQTLTLAVAHGTLNVTVAGGASITSGNGTNSVVLSGTAAQLSATLASANGLGYTPTPNYSSTTSAPEALSFTLSDGVAGHDKSGTVAINVTPTNDIPAIAGGTPLTINEGGTANFAAAVSTGSGFTQSQLGLTDVDSAAVQTIVKISGLPSQGILKFNGNPVAVGSTFSVADIANLSYTQNGTQVTAPTTDTFKLTFDDGAGGLVADQTVTVNLVPVNQPPTVSGSITVIEGETGVRLDNNGLLPAVLGGGGRGAISVGDPEGAIISSYNITSLPSNGKLFFDGTEITAASVGTPFVVSDITKLIYSHDGSNTTADSFNISVTDNGGGTGVPITTSGTVSLSIYPNDDDPVLATNVTQTLSIASSSLTITSSMLRVTDTDSPDSRLTYTLTSVPNLADGYFKLNGLTLTAGTSFTQADIDAGRLIYVNLSPTPRTDSISFTVKDGGQRILPDVRDGGIYANNSQGSPLTVNTFSIQVPGTVVDPNPAPGFAPSNTAPSTGGTNLVSPLEGETVTLTTGMLGATDADNLPAELVYRLHTLPTSGSVTLNGVALLVNQTFTQLDVNNGNVRFAHAGGEDFNDNFTYSVSDGKTISSVETFNITTTPQNDTPTGTTAGQFVVEGGSFNVTTTHITLADADNSVSDNETGFGVNNALSFLITGTVTNGTLKLNGVDVIAGTTIVTSVQLAAGNLVYEHNGGENFTDSFKLVPVDDKGITAGTATNKISTGTEVTVPITIYPLNDAPSFHSKLELTGVRAIQEGSTAIIGGASYAAIINGIAGSGVPTPVAGAHLVFGDNDNSSIQRQYRVTAAPADGQLLLSGASLGVGSAFTQDDLDSGRISYKHSGTETSTDSFSYVVSDGDYGVNDSTIFAQGVSPVASVFQIEITPRNDAPTLNTATTSLDAFASGAGTTAIPGITLADPDLANGVTAGETDFVRIEVQVLDNANAAVSAAQLNFGASDPSGGNAFISGKNSNSLVIQGTKAQIDAILASLTIAFSADADASDYKIRITADDRLYDSSGVLTTGANGGPGALNADGTTMDATNNRVTKDIVLRASNSNDVPSFSNANSFTVNEDATVVLSGYVLSDADSFGEDVTVLVELYTDAGLTTKASNTTQARLQTGTTTGLTTASGNNTNTITLTGSISEVTAALNSLKVQGQNDFNNGPLFVKATVTDFNHAGGSNTTSISNTVTLVPVNDVPTLTVPANTALATGTSVSISGFAVGDTKDISQGAADLIEVTIKAEVKGSSTLYGSLGFTQSGTAIITSNNSSTVTIKGSTADVQNTLNSLIYTPTNPNEDKAITVTTTVDDRDAGVGNGKETTGVDGNNTVSNTFDISISSNNDAPILTVPATLTVNEDSIDAAVTGISLADSDDFGAVERVTLDLGASAKGTITMTTLTGLTFTTGDGTSDTMMVFTGTKAAINTALATLKFTPTTNLNTVGGANVQNLTVTVDDLGNTGTGGPLTDTEILAITLAPVNDAPTRSAASVTLATETEDSAPTGVTVDGLFGPVFSDATDTQTGGSSANVLAGVAIVGNAATAAQGKWQYSTNSGTSWNDLPAAPSPTAPFLLGSSDLVRFSPAANWNGTPGQLSVRLIDNSSGAVTTGAGSDISGVATGGTTAYANLANEVTLGTTISAVNDAPVASGTATLNAINEDTTNPSGALVSALITGSQYSDTTDTVTGGSTATALGGIAITANTANATTEGNWQYSTNGGTNWTTVPTSGLGDTTALILPTDAKLRFVPVADYAGTPGNLTVRLADSAQTTNTSANISGSLGGTNTWSAATATIATTISPVNDAPTITALSGSPVTVEQQASPVRLDADGVVTVFDKELGNNWNQSSLTVHRSGAVAASDVFSFIDDSATAGVGVETSGANLLVDGVTIGTFTNTGGSLVVTFNTSATAVLVGKAMGAVAYRSTSDTPPATVQINFTLNDKNSNVTGGGTNGGGQNQGAGGQLSAQSSVVVAITAVNDAPTIAFLDVTRTGNYVENAPAIQIDTNAVVTDPELDATNWNKATLSVARNGGANADDVFGGTGALSFTGTTSGNVVVSGVTVGTYTQSAGEIVITFNTNATAARADQVMQGMTYKNTSEDPPASVTLTYTVNDQNPNISGGGTAGTGVNQGNGGRLIATSNTTINITRINDAPVLSVAPPAVAYTEQAAAVAVDSSITLTDVDDSQMASASVTISPGSFVSGDTLSVATAGTGITASYNAGTGVLTLSGSDTTANYQQVLRSLSFSSTSDDPTLNTTRATRSLTIAVTDANSDGAGAQTSSTVRTVNLTAVNDTPLLTGAGSTRSYTENGAAIVLEPGLTLADVDDSQLDQAIIKIGSGFIAGDRLNFTNQSGISGSYNATTGVLTLTGTASFASYQTALRSITFDSSSENPGNGARTVNWAVRDVNSDAAANGKQTSLAGTTTINVAPVNDDPVAQLDTNSLGKAATSPVTGNVLANDSDIDAGTLTVSGLTGGAVGTPLVRPSGTLTVNPNGTYSFAVNASDPTVAALGAGATLVETYTYTISDGQGGTSTAQIRITINGANNAPIANPDTNNISEGTASVSVAANGILGNDSDLNSDPLTVTGIINGANQPLGSVLPVSGGGTTATGAYGTLLVNPNGSYTFTLNNSNPTVNALGVGQSLTDVYTYAISDGKGGTSTANITITINGTNDGPDALNDTSSVPANAASVSGNALSNDSDPDATDTLTVTGLTGGAVGTPLAGTYGSITVNANGSYIFTPNATTAKALAAGQTASDTFTYTISDGHGGTDSATITITLTGTNDVPDAKADSNTITEDQTTASGNVLTGAQVTGAGASSTVAGSVDTDPDTTDTLVVTGLQTAAGAVGAIGSPLTGVYGSVTLNADGSYSYALDNSNPAVQSLRAGEIRHETFTYTISDGKGGTDTATLDIQIVGANDGPDAVNDAYDTVDTAGLPGGTPIAGNLLVNDSDPEPNTNLQVTAVIGTAAGTVGGAAAGSFGSLTLNADGTFSYNVNVTNPTVITLLAGDSRTDTFTYTISDGNGGFDTATVTFTIHGTNNAPEALNDANLISEDQPVASGNVITGFRTTGANVSSTIVLSADTDANGDPLTVTDIRYPDASLPGGAIGSAFAGEYGALTIQANGDYSYTLDNTKQAVQALKVGETRTELFDYTVNDGRGSFIEATITIVITGVNDAPVASADVNNITEDSAVAATGNVLPNDTDVDHNATKTVSGVAAGTSGSAPVGSVATGVIGTYGTLTLNADGSYSYVLDNSKPAVQALAAGATAIDTFTYAITDDQGAIAFTTLSITIHGQNDAPEAVADAASINAGGTSVSGDLTPGTIGQDKDVDGDPFTVIGFANANGASGTPGSSLPGLYGSLQVAANGSHIYTIDNTNPTVVLLRAGQSMTETYTYTISDGKGGFATSTLTITINGRDDLVAANDSATTNEDTPLTASVAGNDSTMSGGTLTYAKASNPSHGTVVVNADGSYTYTPATNYSGADSFTYTVTDAASGESLTRTVNLTVNPVVDLVAANDSATTNEDTPLTTSVAGNDSTTSGGTLTYAKASNPSHGTVVVNADGSYTYTPATNYNGTDSFTYTVTDAASGESLTRTVNLTVSPAPAPLKAPPYFPPPTSNYTPYAPIKSPLGAAETGFVPALHVLPAVGDAQEQTSGATDSRNIRSQSIGAGLGMDIALFVLPAVGSVGTDNKAITDSINGAMARSFNPDAGSSLLGVDAVVGDSANAAQAPGPSQLASLDSRTEETAPIARKSFAQQLNLAALNRQLGKAAQPLTRASAEAQRVDTRTAHSKPADRSAA